MSIPSPAQLAERRKALGISQARLAELIRSNRVLISYYEVGRYRIPEQRAAQMDAALSILEASFKVAREVAGQAGDRG